MKNLVANWLKKWTLGLNINKKVPGELIVQNIILMCKLEFAQSAFSRSKTFLW